MSLYLYYKICYSHYDRVYIIYLYLYPGLFTRIAFAKYIPPARNIGSNLLVYMLVYSMTVFSDYSTSGGKVTERGRPSTLDYDCQDARPRDVQESGRSGGGVERGKR